MTKTTSIVSGLLSTMEAVALGDAAPHRQDVLNDEWDGIEVDTCCAFDTDAWETGVNRGDHWEIVEQYEDRDAAVVGHAKWVALLKADPKAKIPDEVYWDGL